MGDPSSELGPDDAVAVICVYVITNINTKLGILINYTETVADIKKKILQHHLKAHPGVGEIKIDNIAVKRNEFRFYLTDETTVKSFHRFVVDNELHISVNVTTIGENSEINLYPLADTKSLLMGKSEIRSARRRKKRQKKNVLHQRDDRKDLANLDNVALGKPIADVLSMDVGKTNNATGAGISLLLEATNSKDEMEKVSGNLLDNENIKSKDDEDNAVEESAPAKKKRNITKGKGKEAAVLTNRIETISSDPLDPNKEKQLCELSSRTRKRNISKKQPNNSNHVVLPVSESANDIKVSEKTVIGDQGKGSDDNIDVCMPPGHGSEMASKEKTFIPVKKAVGKDNEMGNADGRSAKRKNVSQKVISLSSSTIHQPIDVASNLEVAVQDLNVSEQIEVTLNDNKSAQTDQHARVEEEHDLSKNNQTEPITTSVAEPMKTSKKRKRSKNTSDLVNKTPEVPSFKGISLTEQVTFVNRDNIAEGVEPDKVIRNVFESVECINENSKITEKKSKKPRKATRAQQDNCTPLSDENDVSAKSLTATTVHTSRNQLSEKDSQSKKSTAAENDVIQIPPTNDHVEETNVHEKTACENEMTNVNDKSLPGATIIKNVFEAGLKSVPNHEKIKKKVGTRSSLRIKSHTGGKTQSTDLDSTTQKEKTCSKDESEKIVPPSNKKRLDSSEKVLESKKISTSLRNKSHAGGKTQSTDLSSTTQKEKTSSKDESEKIVPPSNKKLLDSSETVLESKKISKPVSSPHEPSRQTNADAFENLGKNNAAGSRSVVSKEKRNQEKKGTNKGEVVKSSLKKISGNSKLEVADESEHKDNKMNSKNEDKDESLDPSIKTLNALSHTSIKDSNAAYNITPQHDNEMGNPNDRSVERKKERQNLTSPSASEIHQPTNVASNPEVAVQDLNLSEQIEVILTEKKVVNDNKSAQTNQLGRVEEEQDILKNNQTEPIRNSVAEPAKATKKRKKFEKTQDLVDMTPQISSLEHVKGISSTEQVSVIKRDNIMEEVEADKVIRDVLESLERNNENSRLTKKSQKPRKSRRTQKDNSTPSSNEKDVSPELLTAKTVGTRITNQPSEIMSQSKKNIVPESDIIQIPLIDDHIYETNIHEKVASEVTNVNDKSVHTTGETMANNMAEAGLKVVQNHRKIKKMVGPSDKIENQAEGKAQSTDSASTTPKEKTSSKDESKNIVPTPNKKLADSVEKGQERSILNRKKIKRTVGTSNKNENQGGGKVQSTDSGSTMRKEKTSSKDESKNIVPTPNKKLPDSVEKGQEKSVLNRKKIKTTVGTSNKIENQSGSTTQKEKTSSKDGSNNIVPTPNKKLLDSVEKGQEKSILNRKKIKTVGTPNKNENQGGGNVQSTDLGSTTQKKMSLSRNESKSIVRPSSKKLLDSSEKDLESNKISKLGSVPQEPSGQTNAAASEKHIQSDAAQPSSVITKVKGRQDKKKNNNGDLVKSSLKIVSGNSKFEGADKSQRKSFWGSIFEDDKINKNEDEAEPVGFSTKTPSSDLSNSSSEDSDTAYITPPRGSTVLPSKQNGEGNNDNTGVSDPKGLSFETILKRSGLYKKALLAAASNPQYNDEEDVDVLPDRR